MGDINLDQLCRLCLTPTDLNQLVNIFDDPSNLPVRIMACCSLEVQATDLLPKSICRNCRYQLDKTYIFRSKSKNAESRLKRHIRLINAGKPSHVFDEDEEVDEYDDALKYVQVHEQQLKEQELQLLRTESDALLHRSKLLEDNLRDEVQRLKNTLLCKTKEVAQLKKDIAELQAIAAQEVERPEDEYYVEMLEEEAPIDVKQTVYESEAMQTDETGGGQSSFGKESVDENVVQARYECDPEEYAAIEKAVRATLLNQDEPTLNSNFQLRLEKISENMTKAEVVSDDGNILFMEFNTAASAMATATPGNPAYNRYACVECNTEFSNQKQFRNHLSHHPNDPHEKGIQCRYCSKWCPTKSARERHERTHTGEQWALVFGKLYYYYFNVK